MIKAKTVVLFAAMIFRAHHDRAPVVLTVKPADQF